MVARIDLVGVEREYATDGIHALHVLYELDFDQNYYTFAFILLMKIVL